jgi:membrane protease YdiL (CAAX protease family)
MSVESSHRRSSRAEFGWPPMRRLRGWPMVMLVLAILTLPSLVIAAVHGDLLGIHVPVSAFAALQGSLLRRTLDCLAVLGFCWLAGLRIQGRPNWNGWLLFLLAIVAVLLVGSMVSFYTAQPMAVSVIVSVAFGSILVGIFEESVFRGIILNSLAQRHGIVLSVFASSALFGLLHLGNLLFGESGAQAAAQVTWTFLAGIILAWTYLFSGRNLILVILCHAGYDFSLILTSGMVHPADAVMGFAILIIIPLQLAAVITLTIAGVRRSDRFTPYKPEPPEESLLAVV